MRDLFLIVLTNWTISCLESGCGEQARTGVGRL